MFDERCRNHWVPSPAHWLGEWADDDKGSALPHRSRTRHSYAIGGLFLRVSIHNKQYPDRHPEPSQRPPAWPTLKWSVMFTSSVPHTTYAYLSLLLHTYALGRVPMVGQTPPSPDGPDYFVVQYGKDWCGGLTLPRRDFNTLQQPASREEDQVKARLLSNKFPFDRPFYSCTFCCRK